VTIFENRVQRYELERKRQNNSEFIFLFGLFFATLHSSKENRSHKTGCHYQAKEIQAVRKNK
jgi:hypothetical protein